MKKDDIVYLSHIFERTTRILETTANITIDEYLQNYLYQDALLRSLEVIGEAANQLSLEFCQNHPELPITEMVGLRNVLIHRYFTVDLRRVWMIAQEDIPSLHKQISSFLK
jgi:uncharacterized protein with HEPN domain